MSPAHQDALFILIAAIGVLFAILVGTLVLSQLRKKNPAPEATPSAQPEATTSTPLPQVAAKAPVEKEKDLRQALKATEENFFGRMKSLFQAGKSPALEDLEEILYTSDLGPKAVQTLLGSLEGELKRNQLQDPQAVRSHLRKNLLQIFSEGPASASMSWLDPSVGPRVVMIVGVNGAGKTTTLGKLSSQAAQKGLKVLVAAGDTFRAAAGEQLKVWSDRAQVEIFSPEGVKDPAAVAFDAVAKAKSQGLDLVLIDTAGRLHTQANLMEELKKVKRVLQKLDPQFPQEVWIVLDANSGQNALMQAKQFHEALGLTGAILTKMDGTAKGGVALGLVHEIGIPVKMIGVGERIQDLRPFLAEEFVDSILGMEAR